jgi:hypothetical protein
MENLVDSVLASFLKKVADGDKPFHNRVHEDPYYDMDIMHSMTCMPEDSIIDGWDPRNPRMKCRNVDK